MREDIKFLLVAIASVILVCIASMFVDIISPMLEPQKQPDPVVSVEKEPEKKQMPFEIFECTAYDLSVQSCGKLPTHPAYGITADGTSLRGKTREMAMAIAVDPNVIPMGSNVYLEFEGSRSKYNGIYKAVDTGGAIKGHRIDVFFGDTANTVCREALEFGRANARVTVL